MCAFLSTVQCVEGSEDSRTLKVRLGYSVGGTHIQNDGAQALTEEASILQLDHTFTCMKSRELVVREGDLKGQIRDGDGGGLPVQHVHVVRILCERGKVASSVVVEELRYTRLMVYGVKVFQGQKGVERIRWSESIAVHGYGDP